MAETLQLRGTLRGHNGYVALVISFCYSNLKESLVKNLNEDWFMKWHALHFPLA